MRWPSSSGAWPSWGCVVSPEPMALNSGARRVAAREKFLAGMNYGDWEQIARVAFDAGWSAHQRDHRGDMRGQRRRRLERKGRLPGLQLLDKGHLG
jgi:hypothetical protein